MKWGKVLGITLLLVAVVLATAAASEVFLSGRNLENVVRRSALFGILSIGVAFVIATGGIDLSIGSIICLVGVATPWLLVEQGWSVPVTLALVLGTGVVLGLLHGLLITRLGLQPFVVTLCGLLLYRGAARGLVNDRSQGFRGEFDSLQWWAQGELPVLGFGVPVPLLVLIAVALLAAVVLNRTVYGRHLLATGRNEEAARLSGVPTERVIVLAYGICGALSGLGGLLFVLDVGSAQPVDFGSFYELYAIAAAVLGGVSLRGGEAGVVGVLVGATLMQVLRNAIILVDAIPSHIEFAVIGLVILGGVSADELVQRAVARRGRSRPAGS
ncbi:MAG: ABC transporter permease [Planctomycetes bacterium]|nr:ABC transporter permease [Planctomycetota bacterium]